MRVRGTPLVKRVTKQVQIICLDSLLDSVGAGADVQPRMCTSVWEVFLNRFTVSHERQVIMGTKTGTRGGVATQQAPKQRPAQTIRYGRLKVTIWKQESENGPWYTVVPSRTYKDQSGNWQSSASFGRDDLLLLAKLADQAQSWIWRQMAQDAGAEGNGQLAEDEEGLGNEPESVPF